MRQHLQQLDLAQRCDGEAILFVVHQDLLQGVDVAGAEVSRFVDFAKGALAEFLHHLVLADLGAALEAALEPFGGRRSRRMRHGGGDVGVEENTFAIVVAAVVVLRRRLRNGGANVADARISCGQDGVRGRRCHRCGPGGSYCRDITIESRSSDADAGGWIVEERPDHVPRPARAPGVHLS